MGHLPRISLKQSLVSLSVSLDGLSLQGSSAFLELGSKQQSLLHMLTYFDSLILDSFLEQEINSCPEGILYIPL